MTHIDYHYKICLCLNRENELYIDCKFHLNKETKPYGKPVSEKRFETKIQAIKFLKEVLNKNLDPLMKKLIEKFLEEEYSDSIEYFYSENYLDII